MTFMMAILVGVLYAGGVYMILRRSVVKIILGLILIGHASNLLIFTVGRLTPGIPAFIDTNATTMTGNYAEPLPQALILTAIVIGFGVQAFAIVLFKRAYIAVKSDDIDILNNTDKI